MCTSHFEHLRGIFIIGHQVSIAVSNLCTQCHISYLAMCLVSCLILVAKIFIFWVCNSCIDSNISTLSFLLKSFSLPKSFPFYDLLLWAIEVFHYVYNVPSVSKILHYVLLEFLLKSYKLISLWSLAGMSNEGDFVNNVFSLIVFWKTVNLVRLSQYGWINIWL